MAVAAPTAPTQDSDWIVTDNTATTVATSRMAAHVMAVVWRAWMRTARWNEIQTEPAGEQGQNLCRHHSERR